MTTKAIEYCYPTSENADRFGLKNGGYCVQVIEHKPTRKPPVAVAGYKTEEEAREHAAAMALPFDELYLRFHPRPKANAAKVGKTADLFSEDDNGREFFGDFRVPRDPPRTSAQRDGLNKSNQSKI